MINTKEFFDDATWTLTYVVWDPKTRDAVVIDPVMDYDQAASKVGEKSVQEVIEFIKKNELNIHLVLETHAHADHLSGSQLVKKTFPKAKIAIGSRIREVQDVFKSVFALPAEFKTDGSQFDRLIEDNEVIRAGSLEIKAIFTPGHTPACVSYLINGEAVFAGDALFMPDYGTGRCDFPSGSADMLYHSVQDRLYDLPDAVKVYTGHDYMPGGRSLRFVSSIGEEKSKNIHIKSTTSKNDFIKFRTERDKTLTAPKLLLPAVQVNIDAGRLPPTDKDGRRYLKIPIG